MKTGNQERLTTRQVATTASLEVKSISAALIFIGQLLQLPHYLHYPSHLLTSLLARVVKIVIYLPDPQVFAYV